LVPLGSVVQPDGRGYTQSLQRRRYFELKLPIVSERFCKDVRSHEIQGFEKMRAAIVSAELTDPS